MLGRNTVKSWPEDQAAWIVAVGGALHGRRAEDQHAGHVVIDRRIVAQVDAADRQVGGDLDDAAAALPHGLNDGVQGRAIIRGSVQGQAEIPARNRNVLGQPRSRCPTSQADRRRADLRREPEAPGGVRQQLLTHIRARGRKQAFQGRTGHIEQGCRLGRRQILDRARASRRAALEGSGRRGRQSIQGGLVRRRHEAMRASRRDGVHGGISLRPMGMGMVSPRRCRAGSRRITGPDGIGRRRGQGCKAAGRR